MDLSLKFVAQNCLMVMPTFSILYNVFGYFFNPGQVLSLKRQLKLLQGHGLNVNIILVADDNFTWEDWEETQYAIQFMRDIYANVDVCIRKIRWQAIHATEAGGYATIDVDGEAHDLTDDWNGPNSGYLDVFVVRSMVGADGVSAVDGPCSKDDKDEMTGSVVSLNGIYDNSGNTFAHEIGHYLGLGHIEDTNNFIGGGPIGSDSEGASNQNTGIYDWQGDIMKKHCYVKHIC
jgi:hypothetical protein